MATTTNFGWETPDDTDLVKDGAAAIRTALGGVDTSFVDLKGGTTGQVLAKASNTDLDYTWSTPVTGNPKHGCLIYGTATQSNLTQNTNVAVTWSDEFYDTDAYHNTSTNTSRITIPAGLGGLYHINASINWSGSASASYSVGKLYKNGSLYQVFWQGFNNVDIELTATLSITVETVATDYWEVFWFTNAAGTLDILKTITVSNFGAVLVGV